MKNFTLNSLLILLSLVILNCDSTNFNPVEYEGMKMSRNYYNSLIELKNSKTFNYDSLLRVIKKNYKIIPNESSIPEGVSSACFCADYFNGANSYGQTSSQKQKCNKMYICLANAMKDCIGGTSNVWSRSDC